MYERRRRTKSARIDDPEEMKKIRRIWMRNNFYALVVSLVMIALLLYGKGCGSS